MLHLARVTKVYPESRTADVVLVESGGPLLRVPILGASGGDTGAFDTPEVEHSGTEHLTGKREMVAVVAPVGLHGFCIVGFIPPPRREGMFADGRMVYRHASDTYFTIDKDGNAELSHPSGTFIRLGTPGHEDLAGQDVDGNWAIKRNTSAAPTVTIGTAAGGTAKSTVTIAPDGALSITTQGKVDIASQGPTTVTTAGAMSLTAAGIIGLAGSAIGITAGGGGGDATVTGTVRINGDIIVTAGDVVVTGGDVIADGISLKNHVHTGVTPGGGDSGPPKV